MGVPFLVVPRIRINRFWGLYWGPYFGKLPLTGGLVGNKGRHLIGFSV